MQLDPDPVRAFQSHYAGRRSLAVWVAATTVPERLLSCLAMALWCLLIIAVCVPLALRRFNRKLAS